MFRWIALALTGMLLVACGGGGGGDDGFRVRLATSSISLNYTEGQAPTSASISANSSGTPPNEIYINAIADGQGIDPNIEIAINGRSGTITVRAASGLIAGTYSGTLKIYVCDDYACNHPIGGTPLTANYSVTVHPTLRAPEAQVVKIDSDTLASELNGQATVNVSGGTAVSWSASTNKSWLNITRASGLTGSNLEFSIAQEALTSLANLADHKATVTITSSAAHFYPITFDVTLRMQLGETHFAGPYVIIADREQTILLSGGGFASVASLSDRINMAGTSITSVQLRSDTEVALQLPPLSAGSYPISISNELGINTSIATLKVIAPQQFAAATLPAAGYVRSLTYDAIHSSVFAANVDSQALVKWSYNGDAWSMTSIPIALINDVGMAPDGESVVVTSHYSDNFGQPGILQLINPADLTEQFRTEITAGVSRNLLYASEGIATSVNGRSWFPVGSGWGEFAYFDHLSRTMQSRPTQTLSTDFYGGPWAAISRNGGHMILTQSASISPRPPMLYLDSYDSLLKQHESDYTFFYHASLSDSGDRILLDHWGLFDSGMNKIGEIPNDSSMSKRASRLSPDGRRAYVLISDYWHTQSPLKLVAYDLTGDTISKLGEVDMPALTDCNANEYGCGDDYDSLITPDGKTLFFVNGREFAVVPIPVDFQ